MQTHKHYFCCFTYLLAPVPDRDVGLLLGLESHCSLWSVSNTWLRPWGAVARQGLRNSRSRAQTFPHNPLPTRGCPSVSTQCSPVCQHRRARSLQAGAERGENRSVVTPQPARAGRCSRTSTHGTQWGLLPFGPHRFCSPHSHLSPVFDLVQPLRGSSAAKLQPTSSQGSSLSAQDWTLLFSAPKIKAFVQEAKGQE